MVTDGVSSEPDPDPVAVAEDAASSAKLAGTHIIPVFISSSGYSNESDALDFMGRLSSNGEVFYVSDFGSLNSLQGRLVDQVSCL